MKDLDYEGRRNRENQIWNVEAKGQTVKWIWESSFAKWTSEAGGLLWICGKPASGKSTLMDSIARSTELADRLRCRSGGKCSIIRHFFDFRAGNGIDNNFEGLLRSLLYQLVDDSRDNWDVNLDGVDLPKSESKQQWSTRALKEAMKTVLRQYSHPICILLDGLDEYEDDKWSLATFVRELAIPTVKICIASRPDPVFSVSFKDFAIIKMEERNTPAIDEMVRQTIQCMANPGFYESSAVAELAERVSKSANGVFLWARFAIEEVRDGLIEGLDLSDIYKRLDDVPHELEDIYTRVFEQIKPEQKRKTAHMLQLVCYARRTLTLDELYVATAHATGAQDHLVEQVNELSIARFKTWVFAVTRGVLELYSGHEEVNESDIYMVELPSGARESWRTDEPHSSSEPSEDGTNKTQKAEKLLVNVIHRTFRTYMDSMRWSQVLDAAHVDLLPGHSLWLRVCARTFPPSFEGLRAHDSCALTQNRNHFQPERSSHSYVNTQMSSERTMGSWPVFGKPKKSPLLKYAAKYMLIHATNVEQDLGPASYKMLQPGMSESFVHYHRLYARDNPYHGRKVECECSSLFLTPLHPLHIAIGHGLFDYVKAYLSTNCEDEGHEWAQVSHLYVSENAIREILDIQEEVVDTQKIPEHIEQAVYLEKKARVCKMSLLGLAIFHASKRYFHVSSLDSQIRIVVAILNHNPHVWNVDMLFAVRRSPFSVVRLLLSYLPERRMVFNSKADEELQGHLSTNEVLKPFQEPFDVGPLWYIARRSGHVHFDGDEELIGLFLDRGEDINQQCGPFGTPLHGALLHVLSSHTWNPDMLKMLVSKGADVNAVGVFGTPLEFVWRLLNTSDYVKDDILEQYQMAIGWLIREGATNNRPDPNGSVPTRAHMLDFAELGVTDLWDFQRSYRGDSIHEESGEEDGYNAWDEYDQGDGPDEPDNESVEDEEGEEAEY